MKKIMMVLIIAVGVSTSVFGQTSKSKTRAPEYFSLRPEVEKLYGYAHAVRIGDDLKISGAVSMDEKENLTAPGNLEQRMKNC